MFRGTASGIVIALFLAGCSGPARMDLDPTPVNPTAVTETHLLSQGIKDFPAFEATTRTYSRTNMQRRESSVTGVDDYAQFLGGAGDEVRIHRLDRKLAWTLDATKKQYTECPLKGCSTPIPGKPPETKPANRNHDAECRLKIGIKTFTIEQTGRKRSINGFDTEQYAVQWQVVFKDNASRTATSTVSIDLWTTPVTTALRKAMTLEQNYARARNAFPDLGEAPVRSQKLPIEVGRMLNIYLSRSVSPTDRSNFLAGARTLDEVKGHPILMKVTWRFAGEACSMDETMKDVGNKPLFVFMSEVKSFRLEAQHESLFAPPKGYRIMK